MASTRRDWTDPEKSTLILLRHEYPLETWAEIKIRFDNIYGQDKARSEDAVKTKYNQDLKRSTLKMALLGEATTDREDAWFEEETQLAMQSWDGVHDAHQYVPYILHCASDEEATEIAMAAAAGPTVFSEVTSDVRADGALAKEGKGKKAPVLARPL